MRMWGQPLKWTVQGVTQSLNWKTEVSTTKMILLADLGMVSVLAFPICDSPLLIQIKFLSRWDGILYLIGEKHPTSAQRHKSWKWLPFPQMSSPVRDSWVLSGRDEGQQASFLLLFGCCSVWETGIWARLVSNWVSCCGETPSSSANFPPLPTGTAYQTLKFFSQGVLVCCDSWQHIPAGKWWTGSGESKINYEVGEISALQITVQWFHWNGSVWQHTQTHTAGQSTQTLLHARAACMGREGVLLG